MSEPKIEKCIHCGAWHTYRPEECLAVKKITYRPYVYDHGHTVSWAGVESVEYLSLDEQLILREKNANAQPPEVEHANSR